ncbi:MAG: GHKL domain-containing protein [Defluviitaleaceae bacterium]|nr:GHKL domain-containing protein [Defluviitaleaceae bacterium]
MLYLFIALGIVTFIGLIVLTIRLYLPFVIDKRISTFQNDLMIKHYNEVQHIYDQMRGWRHDYHNHIQAMKAFLALGQETEHHEYLNKLDADLTQIDNVIKVGNVMVDAILNSKISIAKEGQININVKATVPKDISVSEIDLSVIIGNLMDNAIEANLKIPDPAARFIRIYIGNHKSMLYISVTNATGISPIRKGGRFRSTKKSPSHGFGLIRIDRIAAKCSGFVNRQSEEGAFATEVMLPL